LCFRDLSTSITSIIAVANRFPSSGIAQLPRYYEPVRRHAASDVTGVGNVIGRRLSSRPILNQESGYASKITAIAGGHRCPKLQGNRCNPQIVVFNIQFGADQQIELCPCRNGHGNDGEMIPGNHKGGQQHRGMLFGLRRFCRASQGRPTANLFFQGNGAHAQLIGRVTDDGCQNLGVITLIEAEHVRVEQEDHHGSWDLGGGGTFPILLFGAKCFDGRQPLLQQGIL
jgi:hypothetical protein